jgi:hypothetical protein
VYVYPCLSLLLTHLVPLPSSSSPSSDAFPMIGRDADVRHSPKLLVRTSMAKRNKARKV